MCVLGSTSGSYLATEGKYQKIRNAKTILGRYYTTEGCNYVENCVKVKVRPEYIPMATK